MKLNREGYIEKLNSATMDGNGNKTTLFTETDLFIIFNHIESLEAKLEAIESNKVAEFETFFILDSDEYNYISNSDDSGHYLEMYTNKHKLEAGRRYTVTVSKETK